MVSARRPSGNVGMGAALLRPHGGFRLAGGDSRPPRAVPTPSKARQKQCLEGKPLTPRHSTKNLDTMEPELQVLPMLVYLLIYQEHQRRR
ncbi:hypothetical protein NDU88_001759 [Pleurodeles waltl]|uniref:Uncharacterized protein n=1 Tax=Pleurodeles waltl TaxID=8319 RepID=A0AAV7WJC2_PLEWA|nr:hypothetical protein NDU88_001759 [Pleurodeles waltl]